MFKIEKDLFKTKKDLRNKMNLQLFSEGSNADNSRNDSDSDTLLNDDVGNMTQGDKLIDSEGDKNSDNKVKSLKDILSEDDDLFKEFQSSIDTRVTQALKKRELEHKKELEKQKRLADMSKEELQAEKERELKEREAKLSQFELKLKKIEHFKENDIPLSLVEYVNVKEESEIESKTKELVELIDKEVERKVKGKLKENGVNMSTGEDNTLSLEDLQDATVEEINAVWDKIE